MRGAEIIGLGRHAPERRVLNAEIEHRLGLEEGWIEARTGIAERRWAGADEALTDIALPAAREALAEAQRPADRIGLLLLATSTPDHLLPPSAPLLAHRLGLDGAGGIDLAGACAGFLYALTLADAFVKARQQAVLVVAANILSRRIDFADRASAVLFADAAAAVVLAPTERADSGVLGAKLVSDGSAYDQIKIAGGGSRRPFHQGMAESDVLMRIEDGRAVFTKAVEMMEGSARAALNEAQLSLDAIDYWIPHQANVRIMEATRKRLAVPAEKMVSTVRLFANSSAATIPFSLADMASRTKLRHGQKLLFSAAGAGLTGGSVVFGW